jgi:hypothetical protein
MARRRIRVADFRGEPIELEMPGGEVYLVRGDIPMDVVVHMADLEERLDIEVEGMDDDEATRAKGEEFERWLEEGRELLQRTVREGDPSQREVVIPSLTAHELMGVFGAMVGGESVGVAIAAAMVAGVGEALERKRVQAAEEANPTKVKRQPRRTPAKAA